MNLAIFQEGCLFIDFDSEKGSPFPLYKLYAKVAESMDAMER